MKILMTMLLVSLPAAAQAAGMRHGMGQAAVGVHLASVLYAALAALGYWVLQHASKEAAGLVKKTGMLVGTLIIVIGLLGVLCGVGSHIKRQTSCCSDQAAMSQGGGVVTAMPEAPGKKGK
ncbi:MAG: hypothetical protein COT18_11345 [Elusimicrobia bacterium CG08_land_8_20_14_0_20_59_10]|nr:MAG: hypothetical protein COT18_11345 [Elusimicrobia bacterium CG08_land_8_20_14_0_20_59_10]